MNAKIKWILIGVAGLFAVCIIGLYAYLTPSRLRGIIVPVMEESLERKIELGDVGLSLWGGIAASVEDLTVHDRPGFGSEPFVRAGRARISLAFWPLLSGDPDFGDIVIDEPFISYVVDENGRANIDDLLGDEAEGEGGPAPVLPTGAVRIRDGAFSYTDRRDATRIRVTGIDYTLDLDLSGTGIGLTGDLTVAAVTSGNDPPVGPFGLAHVVRLKDDAIEIESIRPSVFGLSAELIGRVRTAVYPPQVILRLVEQTIDLSDLNKLIPSSTASVSGRLTLSGSIEGEWKSEGSPLMYPALSLRLKAADLVVGDSELPVPAVVKAAEILVNDDRVTLSQLELNLGRSDINLTGSAIRAVPWPPQQGPSPRPQVELTLYSEVLDLDELVPPEAVSDIPWSLTSPAHAAVELPPSPLPDIIRSLDAKLHLAIGALTSNAVVFHDFSADIVARNRQLTVEPMQATVFGGSMTGSVEMDVPADVGADRFPFRAKLDLTAVQAKELLKDQMKWDLPLSGAGRILVNASGTLDPALVVVTRDLKADGWVAFEEGGLHNWSLLKNASSAVSNLSFLNADTISIRSLQSPFTVSDGRLQINAMRFTADGMPTRISGSGGLEDGSLDLSLDLDVPSSRLNVSGIDVSGIVSSLFGGSKDPIIPVRIRVTGTADNPQFGVTLQPAGKQQKAAGKAVDKAKSFLKSFGR